jgi:hypothetical protein
MTPKLLAMTSSRLTGLCQIVYAVYYEVSSDSFVFDTQVFQILIKLLDV